MIDVKEIFESVLLNEMEGGRPVRLAWYKDDGRGAEVLVVGASRNQVKTMLFFNNYSTKVDMILKQMYINCLKMMFSNSKIKLEMKLS